jgi:hypothetical protein
MLKNKLEIKTCGEMVQYVFQFLRSSTNEINVVPKAQQVVIENLDELNKWFF